MNLNINILDILNQLLKILICAYTLISIIILLILYHVLFYFFRDNKKAYALNQIKDSKKLTIEDLKEIPLVNIIIPAWKEGKEFRDCLLSITRLKYPKLKIIVNAGGNEKTINIADMYKKNNDFIILHQKGGKSRAAFGKIKALNECLEYISEGVLYFIDADCYITDEILLRMIYPITNMNENVVINTYRPLKSQENKDLVNYLQINRVTFFKGKFARYNKTMVSGSNTCVNYEVIKSVKKFKENRFISEDVSRGYDIISKGFKIYCLIDYRSRIHSAYPNSIKEYYEQRKRHIENSLLLSYKNKELGYIIKFLIMVLISIYLLIFPIFLYFHFGLFILGILVLLHLYIIKIRKILFFEKTINKELYTKFRKILFIKIIYYLYIEMIFNIITLFGLKSFIRKIQKEHSMTNFIKKGSIIK